MVDLVIDVSYGWHVVIVLLNISVMLPVNFLHCTFIILLL